MNLAFGLFFLTLSTVGGYFLSLKFIERRKFYSDFINFNKNFRAEINYGKNTLLNIINKNLEGKFYSILKAVYNEEDYVLPSFILEDEKDFINNYFDFIGKTDKDSQEKFIDTSFVRLNEIYNSCLNEERKYKKLYVKLGFLIGLIFFIAFI